MNLYQNDEKEQKVSEPLDFTCETGGGGMMV